jgi:hypothetical protein
VQDATIKGNQNVSIQDLGSLGELVAALATVATLAYLSFQIKLITMHSRAYTQRDILNGVVADHERSTRIPAITRHGLSAFPDLDNNDKLEFSANMLSMVAKFEATLRLYRSGLVDEVLFEAHRGWVLAWLTTSGGYQWWELIRHHFSKDVRDYLEGAIRGRIDLPRPITESIPYYGLNAGGGINSLPRALGEWVLSTRWVRSKTR